MWSELSKTMRPAFAQSRSCPRNGRKSEHKMQFNQQGQLEEITLKVVIDDSAPDDLVAFAEWSEQHPEKTTEDAARAFNVDERTIRRWKAKTRTAYA